MGKPFLCGGPALDVVGFCSKTVVEMKEGGERKSPPYAVTLV